MIAGRIGGIFYRAELLDWALHQTRGYALADRVVGFGAVDMATSEFPARWQELYDRFVSEGKRFVKAGAQAILCLGMFVSPVEFSAKEYAEGIGVPVLEGMGCAAAMAQAWHRLGTPWPYGQV